MRLPPRDPELPLLRAVLKADSAAELLGRALPVGIAAAEPDYVKYRPGRSCLVRYRISLRDGTRTLAHAIIASERRAERLWARGGRPDGGGHIPELGLVALLYPADLRLPGLARLVSHAGLDGPPPLSRPELVRYKPGRRAVLRCRSDGVTVYAKLRTDDRGRHLVGVGRALRGLGVATPEPLAYLPAERIVVHAAGEGRRLKDLRGTSDFHRWMEPTVETLARLHAAQPVPLPRHSAEADAAELLGAASIVGALLPGSSSRARRLAEGLAGGLRADDGPVATCHGSFHDDQVLVSNRGVTLLDLDSAMLGDPLLDVGHFASYLSAAGDEAARDAFLGAYERRHPRGAHDALPYEAASLLRWSTLPFRELDPDWPAAVERRVRLAEQRLREHAGAAVPAPSRQTAEPAPAGPLREI